MKMQFKSGKLVMGILTSFCALAITTTASAKNPKEVKLEIDNNKLVIKSKKADNDCSTSGNGQKGCIKVLKNESSNIIFHLNGETKCTLESGTNWKLNAVYLGGFNSADKPKPEEFGFDSTNATDYDKVNADFNITDKSSGLVKTVNLSDKKITINDNNQSEYEVWYKIEAKCEREDGKKAHITTTDPRVKNGGTGSG